MNYGAAFVFDTQTENAMRRLWQAIADAGLPSFMLTIDYPPHLTIFLAEEVIENELHAALWRSGALRSWEIEDANASSSALVCSSLSAYRWRASLA